MKFLSRNPESRREVQPEVVGELEDPALLLRSC